MMKNSVSSNQPLHKRIPSKKSGSSFTNEKLSRRIYGSSMTDSISSLKDNKSDISAIADKDILKRNYELLSSDDEEEKLDEKSPKNDDEEKSKTSLKSSISSPSGWEKRMTRHYSSHLYKEYCLADLSRYKTGQIGLRWRTSTEVQSGKGQTVCANVTCQSDEKLRSWEVHFSYINNRGQKKETLVKCRLCPPCSEKLNYTKPRKEILEDSQVS